MGSGDKFDIERVRFHGNSSIPQSKELANLQIFDIVIFRPVKLNDAST